LQFSSTPVRRALRASIAALGLTAATFGAAGAAPPLSDEEIWAVAAEAFPEHQVAKAVSVAWCESTFDPEARAPYGYLGLFQVDPWLHGWRAERLFGPGASLTDPRVNAAVAAELWAESGWRPWPVCGRR
jgi:soluble lytic murein transglycosylase-like protein